MILDKVYVAAQQFFKILCCCYMIIEFRGHSHKDVHIAAVMMLSTGHRPKQSHSRDTKPRLQLVGMALQDTDILSLSL